MIDALKTQSNVHPDPICIQQFKNTLFEVSIAENITEVAQDDDALYEYDLRIGRVEASNFKELLLGIIQVKYDCNAKFNFESPMTASEYDAFKAFYEQAESVAVKYFTKSDDDNNDFKLRICLTDEIATSDLYDITKMDLDDAKAYCVVLTNTNLEMYLQKNPLYSDVHGGVVKPYNVTTSKQNQMGTVFLLNQLAENAKALGIETNYEVRWNASGEECEPWDVTELLQLAFLINAYVEPFVAEQRKKEKAIMEATSIEELLEMNYTYESI